VAGPWPALRRGCWRDSRAATLVAVAAHRWHPAWRGVRRFIAPSAFLRDALAPVIDARRVTVVANRLPPLPPSSAVSAGGGRRGILFAGRLVPEKGIAVLAEAARRLGAPLTVLGQGPIVLPGARPASQAAVLEAMTRAAVVAVPSLWPEPFGRSALEGMACGAAVVASAVGGLPEVVGPAGLLVPPGDVAAWTEALWRALDDPRQFGRLGRARAAALAGDGAAPLIAVYRSVLTAPDSSHPTASSAKAGTVRA
jgi:glycosyltransferase involved in cell wall biosynthesis